MKIAEIDWSVLRGSLIFLLVSAAIAGVALSTSYRFWNKQEVLLKSANSALSSTRGQYRALDDEEDIIATYLPRYSSLEEEGIIGRERRLDWIDVLRETARKVQLPNLEYALDAQRPFDVGVDLKVGEYGVYASTMNLNLGLLHEGDLVRFFALFRDSAPGLFGVTECDLERRSETPSNNPQARNVTASCELKFITIRGPEPLSGSRS